MNRYFANRLFKVGFWMFVLGSGPLLAIIALAAIGLWPDPNPNPVGPGLLAFFTFWPSIICMIIGAIQARTRASRGG
ncbi:MAG: hypothetical protein WA930_13940 [Rhodanobacter sp.]|jgi:hypothetical protein